MHWKIRHGTKQAKPWRGGRGREREQEENIKEGGQEREREGEERQIERGARRSPACCQVPGFPSPLHKRARQAWIGGGGSREARGPFTKSLVPPLHLRPSHPHLHPHGSSLSPPLSPLQPSDTPAQANYQALCSCTASLILMCIHIHTQTQRAHNSAHHELLTAASHACGNISLPNTTRIVLISQI